MNSVTLFPEAAPHALPRQPCVRARSATVLATVEPLNINKLENAPGIVPRRTSFFSIHPSVKMAAERFRNKIKAPHGHHLFRSNSSNLSEVPIDEDGRKKERHFIECYECNSTALTPDQIDESPKTKEIGASSKQLRIGDFELIKTIGTGTFARVWLAQLSGSSKERCNQKVFALKILRKTDIIRLKQVEHIKNERNTLAAVAGHPFITTMITSFSDKDCLYMLLDYCPGGEVFSYLRRAKRFDEETTRFYAAEIVLILEYLHEHLGIAYRDMKPENILIDAEGHLKLVDFGFAKKIQTRETYTLCGTPEYLAPEVIRNSGHGIAVDWWAFGILVYEFLVGQPPFWNSNPMKIYELSDVLFPTPSKKVLFERIIAGKVKYPHGMSANAKDLISALCVVDPHSRLGNIEQNGIGGTALVKKHPFFEKINWDDLYHRKMKGPIIPTVRYPADCSNFDDYAPPSDSTAPYTKEMQHKYESEFKDF